MFVTFFEGVVSSWHPAAECTKPGPSGAALVKANNRVALDTPDLTDVVYAVLCGSGLAPLALAARSTLLPSTQTYVTSKKFVKCSSHCLVEGAEWLGNCVPFPILPHRLCLFRRASSEAFFDMSLSHAMLLSLGA